MSFLTVTFDLPSHIRVFVSCPSPGSQTYSPLGLPRAGVPGGLAVRMGGNEEEAVG